MIRYEKKNSLITQQAEAEQKFLETFEAGAYTASSPLVVRNPYLISPLTAMILFKTAVKQEVTLTVKGKEPEGDISHTFPADTVHILPVYGLYADCENTVELILSGGERETVMIKTEPLPPEVPVPTFCKGSGAHMGDNVYEMGVHGKIYREYRLPGGYHHDTFEMEDGNILMLSQIPDRDTVEDVLVLVDRQTGAIVRTWDYREILPYDCQTTWSGSASAHDWFHNNAVWYDKKTDSITLSGRHQDAVINIDFKTGALNWILGDPEGWPEEYVEKYFFRPISEPFEWSYEQHGVVVCPDGDIMMFDNGHYRSKVKAHYSKAKDSYSRGVRYHIDREARTIEQVWQYGKERGADFFSPYICNVEYYDEGRYMVHSGGIAYKDGEPLEGLGSMDGTGEGCTLNAITCELVNDEVVYELHVPSNVFRAEKLPMYYAGETAELGAGKTLGSMSRTGEFATEIPAACTGELIPEHYEASVTEEEDRILFNATFEKGELAMLLLEEEDGGVHGYYINTSAAKNFEAMCVGTFLKNDPRNVDVYVNKCGISKNVKVRVLLEDKIYETGVEIRME